MARSSISSSGRDLPAKRSRAVRGKSRPLCWAPAPQTFPATRFAAHAGTVRAADLPPVAVPPPPRPRTLGHSPRVEAAGGSARFRCTLSVCLSGVCEQEGPGLPQFLLAFLTAKAFLQHPRAAPLMGNLHRRQGGWVKLSLTRLQSTLGSIHVPRKV